MLGLRAIKENAGLALVQSPESAKFDAMPRSCIDAGLADIIASPQELGLRISTYLHRSEVGNVFAQESKQQLKAHSALEQIIILLRDRPETISACTKKTLLPPYRAPHGFCIKSTPSAVMCAI